MEALEYAFGAYIGVPHALACSSGTAALHSAYFGLGLEAGDEVIAPTFTFLSTVMPLFVVNAVPGAGRLRAGHRQHRPRGIDAAITSRTKAVVVVHINGHPCDMAPIVDICRRRGLRLVEDASHAHGAIWNDTKVGSFGDVSVFSLQGAKLTAAGQGGLLLTSDREIFERAVLLGHFRNRSFDDVTSDDYRHFATTGYGLNYRMHPLAAALARRQFEDLDAYLDGREANLALFSAGLAEVAGVDPPARRPYVTRHSCFNYKPLYDAYGDRRPRPRACSSPPCTPKAYPSVDSDVGAAPLRARCSRSATTAAAPTAASPTAGSTLPATCRRRGLRRAGDAHPDVHRAPTAPDRADHRGVRQGVAGDRLPARRRFSGSHERRARRRRRIA